MSEADIQRDIIEVLRLRGAIVFRMNAGRGRYNQHLAPPGTPDLLVVEPHRRYWIEVKTPKGVVSLDQQAMHDALENYGEEVIVARSIEDVPD